MTDTREFKLGIRVEDAGRHIGTVTQIYPVQGKVRVHWHNGFASVEETDKLRIVEPGK